MPKAGFVCDVSEYLANKSRAALSDDAKELCQLLTNDAFGPIYFGLEGALKSGFRFGRSAFGSAATSFAVL
jgi:hypothetical protein